MNYGSKVIELYVTLKVTLFCSKFHLNKSLMMWKLSPTSSDFILRMRLHSSLAMELVGQLPRNWMALVRRGLIFALAMQQLRRMRPRRQMSATERLEAINTLKRLVPAPHPRLLGGERGC